MTRVLEMQPRRQTKRLSWEKSQSIKAAKDIRAKAKRRANGKAAKASRKKNR